MVKWGMTPAQAIRSATSSAAELLGWSDQVGAIEAGKYADIVAVAGDPLERRDGFGEGGLRDEGRERGSEAVGGKWWKCE